MSAKHALAVFFFVFFIAIMGSARAQERAPALPPSSALAGRELDRLADIVAPLMPAVVNISTSGQVKGLMAEHGIPEMPPGAPEELQEFFEQFYGAMPPGFGDSPVNPKIQSLGSGFLIDPSGVIVTNNHVIEGADEIIVKLHDETELKAKILGRDMKTDIALLKVDAGKPLPYVKFGDAAQSRVGDWVIAIGNPFGLGGSVTVGIISARARDINAGPFDDFIQTDAAINSGNSGGPMFNLKGEVIGINTAIFTPTGGNVGIGFATPATLAEPVIEQIRKSGKVRWGWLGVKIQSVSREIAESIGLKDAHGALVVEVTEGSPAARSGIKPGDVITQFDGKKVSDMRRFPRMVAQSGIGKPVPVVVWRDGKEVKLNTTLEEAKETEVAAPALPAEEETSSAVNGSATKLLGMRLKSVTPEIRKQLGLGDEVNGLVVTGIDRNSIAWEQGLRSEDILMRLNEAPLTSPAELKRLLADAAKQGRKNALLRVYRQGDTHFVTLPTQP